MIKATETPLMRQYKEMKRKHPDAVLLFRTGDFYEIFGEDAETASELLGLTLVKRSGGAHSVYLCGFPHHALDTYLPRLVRAGRRVAICEQLEDPKLAKRLVKRSPQSCSIQDFRPLLALLAEFGEALSKLSVFEEIRRKTREITALSATLGISPQAAYAECRNVEPPVLPGL